MKRLRALTASLVGVAAVIGFGAASPVHAAGELHLYNWGDYINPEVIDKFSKEFDVKVTLDTYSTNEEMLAKIQAGATGYDLVWPSVHMHDIMQQLELLEKTDVNTLPGFENIDKAALRSKQDPKAEYCLPYAWGVVGIFYNKTLVPEIKSWKDFFAYAEKNPGKVTLLDDLRETLGIGLIVDGKSVNSRDPAEIKAAEEYILKQKPNIAAFRYDVLPLVTSGDIAASHYYVGAVLNVLENPKDLAFVVPEEGATMYQEDLCMLKTAPNKENALKFMEFMMRPDVSVLNTTMLTNGSVNTAAIPLLPDNLKNHPATNPPADVRAKLQIFEDLGPDLKLYDRAWSRVKSN
ncbi:spermidine/putrescine transport system substrate-binding protein [Rhodoligotrophos appendicifer]|uniref:ABC transporter substrate-binding protein n=1 Tax=Rhodoligotrophos appendicifer TaxID=987056 RepID=UPI00118724ED|nr:spermidine/putrescine ABC transporter substrate-binding protein [Rhodoligotrophos appendicifer]